MVNKHDKPEYLDRVRAIIEANYKNNIVAIDLAGQANVSASTLQHDFPEYFGITIHQYHTQCRVNEAKILLENTKYNVKSIGLRVGYKTTGAFINAFKRNSGKSPLEYRESQKHL
jgi:AraC-like DNA-binding protein